MLFENQVQRIPGGTMDNILKQLMQWLTTTECGAVMTKIGSIGATVWIMWLVFDYAARSMKNTKPENKNNPEDDNFPPDAAQLGI